VTATSASAMAAAARQAAAGRWASGKGSSAASMRAVAQARFTAVGRALSRLACACSSAASSAACRHCSAMP